jgi:type II secretory pathway pseudopilin PulG
MELLIQMIALKNPFMKNRKAITLVEVLVSTVIVAMVTFSSFSVFTTSFSSQKKSDKKEVATLAMKMVREKLKNFVTADKNWSLRPNSNWRLCIGSRCDAYNGWALEAGTHDIIQLINTEPFITKLCDGNISNCSFSYTVSDIDCGLGTGQNACKNVVFNLKYPN